MRTLALGGLLHDVAKLAVTSTVLTKPGPLDDAEFAQIKALPMAGYELLGRVSGGFGEDVRRLVRDHHERLDGGGYPSGAQAAELELETRILTVCDV